MTAPKRAYDKAAEAWHTHAMECPTCTLHGSERCEDGERLLCAENAAWNAYRDDGAVSPAVPELSGGPCFHGDSRSCRCED